MHLLLKHFVLLLSIFTFISAEDEIESNNNNDTVPQDLYVIKTVVYEVGILTEAGNDTSNENETHEQVDLSVFNNGSIDLSSIPVPIQANVSGVSVTGLLPGADLASILLPKKQVTVTQNISTSNPGKSTAIVENLPKLLGLVKGNKEET